MPRDPRPAAPPAERLFRALSERPRLRILGLLRGGELCVGDITAVLRLPQPTVSRHLAYLRRCGLVAARRRGAWMFYALAGLPPAARELLDRGLDLGSDWPGAAGDARRLARVRRGGGCCPEAAGGGAACRP